jgi:uroporphyrinogen decarboxylase
MPTLACEFGGKITFLGGVDAQDVMPNGSPEKVKAEVRRTRKLLGPHLIISPSHEAILPDVPPENVKALSEAAYEYLNTALASYLSFAQSNDNLLVIE